MSRSAIVARRPLLFAPTILLITLVAFAFLWERASAEGPIGGAGQIRYGVSQVKGFDTCTAPSESTMQTWMTFSPYWDIGIYIGGVNRGCSQPNLNSTWATNVSNQGWSYYLTWVGPQAPCWSLAGTKMSSDPNTARQQGRNEASNAISAASNLGFTGLNVYYYDMEAYDTTNTSCRNAVNAFVDGWVEQLHTTSGPGSSAQKAGVYGAGCGSAVSDWAGIGHVPDDVWIAVWNAIPKVWGLACVSDTLWNNQQRLHQYNGNVNETWGGIALQIDPDCANGLVTPAGHGVTDTACTNP